MKRWSKGLAVSVIVLGVTGASWAAVKPLPSLPDSSSGHEALAAAMQEQPEPAIEEGALAVLPAQAEGRMAATEPAAPLRHRFALSRVNGISLSDDLKTVYEIKGEPQTVESDPLFKHERVLAYPDARIGLYQNFIQYVMIPAATGGTMDIDGTVLPLEAGALKQALGEPDWTADDGIVYIRDQTALKLFLDPADGKLTSVHYFYNTTV